MDSDPPNLNLPAGTVIDGRYTVLGLVAQGSMGSVYRARQQGLQRVVAVKVLQIDTRVVKSETEAKEHEKRFLREAAVLSKLRNKHTVRVYDYGVWDERPYLVMEYVEGETLRSAILANTLASEDIVRIGRQICEALQEAHAAGVVHRDLKPANILISYLEDDLHVKVVDFGLVKEIDDAVSMTGDGILLGTPLYMSPEQIRGMTIDQRSDLYSLGALLYHALAGRPPFNPKQSAATLMAHLTESVPPFALSAPERDIPEALEWTIGRCLEKDRSERFADAEQLERALRVCEAQILDPDTSRTSTMELERGVVSLKRNAARSKTRVVAIIAGAAALAMTFGFVSSQALLAVRDLRTGSIRSAVQPPQPPPRSASKAAPVAPVVLPPVPEPETPEPETATTPEAPVAPAPAPETRPRPTTSRPRPAPVPPRPRPAPRPRPRPVAPAGEPAPSTTPEPELPAPAEPPPSPAPWRPTQDSDLINPFNKNFTGER